MQLAKNAIDVGLSTNNLEPMLWFWQQDACVAAGSPRTEAVQARRAGLRREIARPGRGVPPTPLGGRLHFESLIFDRSFD
jgi:hypothetical protein